MTGGVVRSERRCALDTIKTNPIFVPGSAAAFQAPALIRSLYIDLCVLAAQLRLNF